MTDIEALVAELRRGVEYSETHDGLGEVNEHHANNLMNRAADALSRSPSVRVDEITDEMVTRAINALVYTGYNDATQIKVIKGQATCREYVRAALQAAITKDKP